MIENMVPFVFPAAFSLLPSIMDSREARGMLLAVGLQESEFARRVQMGGGPARGFWQFEKGGAVTGVLTNISTRPVIDHICVELCYTPQISICYEAIAHNDVLACCFARLLLWSLPGRISANVDEAWDQYLLAWRPGKPRPNDWPGNFTRAWSMV